MDTKNQNRLIFVLAKKKRTNKWFAEHLRENTIISKWCTDPFQLCIGNTPFCESFNSRKDFNADENSDVAVARS